MPDNGLVLYCGTIMTDEGKEKKVNIDFEPFKPINTSLYLCDNKFHTEALTSLLADDNTFGFIVMDGTAATQARGGVSPLLPLRASGSPAVLAPPPGR